MQNCGELQKLLTVKEVFKRRKTCPAPFLPSVKVHGRNWTKAEVASVKTH